MIFVPSQSKIEYGMVTGAPLISAHVTVVVAPDDWHQDTPSALPHIKLTVSVVN